MRDQRVDAIDSTLRRLMPGAEIEVIPRGHLKSSLPAVHVHKARSGSVGVTAAEPDFHFWLQLQETGVWEFFIRRSVAFTAGERRIFTLLPLAISGLLFPAEDRRENLARRTASMMSFEHILIAQLLKKTNASTYWTPMVAVRMLIDLTFARYEGGLASSGFVLTSQVEDYLFELERTGYNFEPFATPSRLQSGFFDTPASFRYVDGRNSFYLMDNQLDVRGVLRLENPGMYDIIDRSAHKHTRVLVEQMPGRAWIGYVGLNEDVNLLVTQGVQLKWERNHWYLKDQAILRQILIDGGCSSELSNTLTEVLYAMAELRMGTAVLIPDSEEHLPETAGKIDHSEIGMQLRTKMQGSDVSALKKAHMLIGVLSSDGLTTISKSGKIFSTGDIINLSSPGGIAGGGRTQAAMSASLYGLGIKVSEDGPISVFKAGKRILLI